MAKYQKLTILLAGKDVGQQRILFMANGNLKGTTSWEDISPEKKLKIKRN